MPEFTDEELEKLIAEKVAEGQRRQMIADNGVIGFTMSLEYLDDQVKRKIIPATVYNVMDQIYATFRVDIGLDAPAQQQPQPEKEPPKDD